MIEKPSNNIFKNLAYVLYLLLIFEGLLRKLAPNSLSIALFFTKDFILIYAVIQLILNNPLTQEFKSLYNIFRLLLAFFVPLLVINAFYDPILVPWGLKQYLFYFIAGLVFIAGFTEHNFFAFRKFLRTISFFIIPTVLIALLQLQLPANHWLNSSVNNEDVSRFAAAGFLRVSSTFSFTGQFSYFLHFISAFIFSLLYFPKLSARIKAPLNLAQKSLPIVYLIFLLFGVFATGGRTAVLGAASVLGVGLFFSLFKNKGFVIKKSIIPLFGLLSLLIMLPIFKPEAFAAYSKRSSGGFRGQSNTEEIQNRIFGSFIDGFDAISKKESIISFLFGDGLGVMTNGVDKLSTYAAHIRESLWTETDFYTTAWEGGIYLVIVWYGFRFYMIFYCFERWRRIRDQGLSISASFFLGYVLVTGIMGTLSLQAPVGIYWFSGIAIVILLELYDKKLNVSTTLS